MLQLAATYCKKKVLEKYIWKEGHISSPKNFTAKFCDSVKHTATKLALKQQKLENGVNASKK